MGHIRAVVLKQGVATQSCVASYVKVCRQTIRWFHFVEKHTYLSLKNTKFEAFCHANVSPKRNCQKMCRHPKKVENHCIRVSRIIWMAPQKGESNAHPQFLFLSGPHFLFCEEGETLLGTLSIFLIVLSSSYHFVS